MWTPGGTHHWGPLWRLATTLVVIRSISPAHLTEPSHGFVCISTARKTINQRMHLARAETAAAGNSCKKGCRGLGSEAVTGNSMRVQECQHRNAVAPRPLGLFAVPIGRHNAKTIRKVPGSVPITCGAHKREVLLNLKCSLWGKQVGHSLRTSRRGVGPKWRLSCALPLSSDTQMSWFAFYKLQRAALRWKFIAIISW